MSRVVSWAGLTVRPAGVLASGSALMEGQPVLLPLPGFEQEEQRQQRRVRGSWCSSQVVLKCFRGTRSCLAYKRQGVWLEW